jgi:hypothetical protein
LIFYRVQNRTTQSSSILLSLGAGSASFCGALALLSTPAIAGCTDPDSGLAVDCTGSITGGISYTDNSVDIVVIKDLTANIETSNPLTLSSTGANGGSGEAGDDGQNLAVEGTFKSGYGLYATETAVTITTTGGAGDDGSHDDTVTAKATGDDGTDGGIGGSISLDFYGSTPTVSTGAGLTLESKGGNGGDGGYANSTSGSAHGGDGGVGGIGQDIWITLDDDHALDIREGNGIGISASSIGGNGGNGDQATTSLANGYGGDGGDGGDGGRISINAYPSSTSIVNFLDTEGDYSHGVLAQSLAGSGGNGDLGEGIDGYGGDGAVGGSGGEIDVSLNALIYTVGDKAQGILARSYGGAGGSAGDGGGLFDGNGGADQGPGHGGNVSIAFGGSITTTGDEANGILAQSVGGFSGNAGDTSELFLSYGANAQSGGDAYAVYVEFESGAQITTGGDYSVGVHLISSGGGGGKGSSDTNGFETLGADGSAGGAGGTVTFKMDTTAITTTGDHAGAVELLSVGGGGGASGSIDAVKVVGGDGGSGGDGGEIDITLSGGSLNTSGQYSDGLLASSIGGGGGLARSANGLEVVGGNGGDGGDGKAVALDVTGSSALMVTTTDDDSDGIFLQSIGGGGGKGGASFSFDGDQSTRVGGAGGDGGDGSTVTYTQDATASINTSGDRSRGFVIQSVGGGGGQGGDEVSFDIGSVSAFSYEVISGGKAGDGGNGDTVDANFGAAVTTRGDLATGVLAQSVGGGGGISGSSMSLEVASISIDGVTSQTGADGGDGGDGETVNLVTSGVIKTSGAHADGVIAQSIGGGGGASGAVASASVESVNLTFSSDAQTTLGGSAGVGGDAGDVSATISGNVSTGGGNSFGVLAQSVGGGGGIAGMTTSVEGLTVDNMNLTVGQSGGSGGNAGTVDLTIQGDITTGGHNSIAVLGQSIGGSGGSGGNLVTAEAMTASINIDLGGVGGTGGSSDTVQLTNGGAIATSGMNSAGLVAQSLGGGGGNGGTVLDASVEIVTVDIDIGSDGSDGSIAGWVQLDNSGTINTSGTFSYGALAQSIGGQGGNAGLVTNVSVDEGVISGAVTVNIGGTGGDGGTASSATLTSADSVVTNGFGATGLLVQSIGGQGGVGGSVIAGQLTATTDGSMAVNVAVGGDGGEGGVASNATVINYSGVTTYSHFADGIQAQSISGNGGAGGGSYVGMLSVTADSTVDIGVSVGGDGGDGGTAGNVSISNIGDVTTYGGMSNGLYGQSIGGSGGDGGSGFAVVADFGATTGNTFTGKVSTAVGGTGGTGNDAGTVSITNSASVTTNNGVAQAMFAQSVGGGGGDGGSASAHTLGYLNSPDDTDNASFTLDVQIGGSGGAAGDGNLVTATNAGQLRTNSFASYGIFAQSVGGGGGNASSGPLDQSGWVDTASDVADYVTQAKQIYKQIKDPSTIFTKYSIDLGGSAGASGVGGEVKVTNSTGGSITTYGFDSSAIFAQSVGGGGGVGGDASQGVLLGVTLAGGGSGGGDGDDVTVTNKGTIATYGDRAMGIFSQSVGGSGGAAGDVEVTFISEIQNLNLGSGVVAEDGADGDGGNVNISSEGDITTEGQSAHGVFAQSVGGGGGGYGLINLDSEGEVSDYTGYAGSASGVGDGGDVSVTVGGTIAVSGDYAIGVVALSAGGAGSSTLGGDVDITVNGHVRATGDYGRAIVAQSDGSDTSGDVNVTIAEGSYVRSTNGEYGYDTVSLLDGDMMTLTNRGTLENLSGLQNSYVIYASGSQTQTGDTPGTVVNNYGTMTGSISLAANNNNANVYNYGTFHAGEIVNLGYSDNSKFYNYGTISPFGIDTIGTTFITSDNGFEMNSDGIAVMDVALGSTSVASIADKIELMSLNLNAEINLGSGTIAPHVTGTSLLKSGDTGSAQIFYAGAGETLEISSATVRDTATVDYSLEIVGLGVNLNYEVDYQKAVQHHGPSHNRRRFVNFMEETITVLDKGAHQTNSTHTAFQDFVNVVLNAETVEETAVLFDSHIPDEAGNGVSQGAHSAADIMDLLQSCPRMVASPEGGFYRQQDCSWSRVQGGYRHQTTNGNRPGYDGRTYGMAAGLQREAAENVFVEIAGHYERSFIDGSNYSQNGYSVTGGAALKLEVDAITVSGSLAGGIYQADYSRSYTTNAGNYVANSTPRGQFVSAEGRVSAVFEKAGVYAKPSAALTATWLWQDQFKESGSGALHWDVDSVQRTSVTLRPSLEIGAALDLFGQPAVAYVRGGATAYLNDPDYAVTSRLSGLDSTFPDLTSGYSDDRFAGHLAVGLHVDLGDSLMLSTMAEASLSENAHSIAGYGKLSWKF